MNSIWNKILITFIIIFVSKSHTFSQQKADSFNPNYTVIQDLSDNWQVFDERYEGYVPYIRSRHQNPKTVSFWIDLEKYKLYDLVFLSPENETYIFINNGLSKKLEVNKWFTFDMDSLSKKYKNKQKIFCTFYSPSFSLPISSIYIGQKKSLQIVKKEEIKQKDWYEAKQKENTYKSNFVISIFFLILILYTFFYKNYPKELAEYFSLNYARFRNEELGAVLKPFMTSYLLVILGHICIVAFFYFFAQKDFTNIIHNNIPFLYQDQSLVLMVLSYGILLLIVLIIFITKYALLWLASNILNLDNIINIHFYEYFRLSYLFYTGLVASLVVFYLISYTIFPYFANYIIYVLLTFHVLQTIVTSIIISQKVEFKNLYLFYYLCITELTPILIGVKLLLFN